MTDIRSNVLRVCLLQRFAFGVIFGSVAFSQGVHAARKAEAKAERSDFTDLEIARIRAQMLLFRDEAVALMPFAFEETRVEETKATVVHEASAGSGDAVPSPRVDAQTLKSLESFAANAAPQRHAELFKSNPMAKETFDILSHTLRESAVEFRAGRVSSSRQLLKASYHACLTCHASGLTKTSFRFVETDALAAKASTPLKKARIYFVFRDFEKARDAARSVLGDLSKANAGTPTTPPHDSREAMEIVLSTSILLDATPASIALDLDTWKKNLVLPAHLAAEVKGWNASVSSWSREPKPKSALPLSKLRTLVGQKSDDDLLPYQGKLVDHLRARDALSRLAGSPALTASQRAETLHLLGLIHKAHDNELFLGFADAYFSSCIRLAPRTAQARRCFQSLRASIIESNTGSSGTHMESEETNTLKEMGALAGVAKPLP